MNHFFIRTIKFYHISIVSGITAKVEMKYFLSIKHHFDEINEFLPFSFYFQFLRQKIDFLEKYRYGSLSSEIFNMRNSMHIVPYDESTLNKSKKAFLGPASWTRP